MDDVLDIYVRLFVIVPLLVYTGYHILREHTFISTMLFHFLVLLVIVLTLYFHLKYLIKVVRRIFQNETYQRKFGIFLLSLAIFITILCVYDLHSLKKRR